MKVQMESQPQVPPSAAWTEADAPRPGSSPEAGELQCVGEVNVLVLDDDPAIGNLVQAALAQSRYHVEAESDPSQMEERLQSKTYHLILLDYVLPGLTPQQVFGWVQKHQPDASIIAITGYPSIDSALDCLRARTFDYLTKPFQIASLQQTVKRCLESKGLLRMTEEALREALGSVIRERRKALALTLKQLAERTNVSLGYLSQIELGKNSASIETLYRISLGLGTKLSDLFEAVERRC